MATMKIKELFNMVESPFVLDPTMAYPEIEGSTFNFLEDYNDNKALYDYYFIKEHGSKLVDVEGEEDSDIVANWKFEIKAIQRIYLEAWARIYYTLNIAYNPVYNVEEHITNKYGDHETETEYGAHEIETEYGNTSDTLGSHTDTTTSYAVSFDSQTEKETGKSDNVIGSQTNTSTAHTDTETSKLHTDTTTSKLHTDTVDRTGNIGIKSASALAEEEVLLREKMIFFKNIFLTISREVGAYYDN